MSDDILDRAKAAWRSAPDDVDAMRLRLRRGRFMPHLVLAAEIIGCLVGLGFGVYFLRLAFLTHQLLYILSAVMMGAGMPLTMVGSIYARRDSLKWEDQTPTGVVATAARRAEATLRSIRLGRLGVLAIGVFVLVLWLGEARGAIHAARFLIFYTVVSLAICLPYLVYLHLRARQARRQIAACDRLLAELDV